MTAALLELKGVCKEFLTPAETLHVLKGVDLKIKPGETLAVTGPSGSGKSTLLAIMAGLERPDSGLALFRGSPLGGLGEDDLALWRRRSVGFLFQSFRLAASLTALENAALPLEILGLGAEEAAARAATILGELGLASRVGHFPHQLSGGEQQRVAMARAYVHGPELILADEPTGALDRETADKTLEALLRVHQDRGAALVVVTHDPAVAGRMSRQVRLERGSARPA
jgi:putative ABC transport system ATP-binding protein